MTGSVQALRSLFLGASILAGLLLSAGAASAQSLFQQPTTAEVAAAERQPRSTAAALRSRVVRIDTNVLKSRLAPANSDSAADRVAQAETLEASVTLNLFADVTPVFRRTGVSERDGGGLIWEGAVQGQAFHEALLLIRSEQVHGRIQLFDRVFEIEGISGALHRITELAPIKMLPDNPVSPPRGGARHDHKRSEAAPVESTEAGTPEALTQITILVAYTTTARTEAGGTAQIEARIDSAIAQTNQALSRGALPFRLKLVKTMVVTYPEGSGAFSGYLKNLNDVSGANGNVLSNVRTKREQFSADLVSLFRKDPGTCNTTGCVCGLAHIPGVDVMPTPGPGTANFMYSVVAHNCVAFLAFQHEIGHNLALNHDRYQYKLDTGSANPPANKYNFGYSNLTKRVIDIMAYTSQCASKGLNCAKVNYFSSPTVKAQPGNVTLGIPKGTANAADATLRLKQTYTPVSQYR